MLKFHGAWPVAECDDEAAECHRRLLAAGDGQVAMPDPVWIAPADLADRGNEGDGHWFGAAVFLGCVSAFDAAARLALPGHNQGPLTWRVAFAALNEAGECLQTVAPIGAGGTRVMVYTRLLCPETTPRR